MIEISTETLRFIQEHSQEDVRNLALKASKYPQVDMPTAVVQIAGKQIALEKIPSWANNDLIRYPKHLSMEQCSSEVTARYKAERLQGDSLTDLTGGLGVDCSFLASRFQRATYVERQEELCQLAQHNFPALGLNHITVCNEDGVKHLEEMEPVDCLFLDPARRNEQGGKTVAISDCEPDVAALEEWLLSKAQRVMIKLSPMLDLSLALKEMKHTEEVHILSVNNECKELLLLLAQEPTTSIPIHCVNLQTKGKEANLHPEQHFVFTQTQEAESVCRYTDELKAYLYEPNASLQKAGAFKSLSQAFDIEKLHPNSHLFTSDRPIEDFPGRIFRVVSQCTLNKKELKECLGDLKQANLTVRNFPSSVAELRKRIKLAEGGNNYLFATTLNNGKKVLIRCEKVERITIFATKK